MPSLKDSSATTIAGQAIDMRVNQKNFQILEPDVARIHVDRLAFMLTMVSQVMQKRLPQDGGNRGA